MKKIFNYITIMILAGLISSCGEDYLNTSPTDRIPGDGLFNTATNALIPLNGIYRLMYTQGWSLTNSTNTQQCDGLTAWNLAADVMGEDMVMKAQGSGWYWYDCIYNVKSRYNSTGWRPYDLWNGYYTLISNANYIIAAEETMEGTEAEINYVVGQAYAIRAYCYYHLSMWFARTYVGHEDEACVPIYTEPTTSETEGQPRATNREVYTLIVNDINKAISLLEKAPKQDDKTHIDYYVANGIKARISLTMNDWDGAASAAKIARSNYTIGTGSQLTSGMNDVSQKNVMWGATIIDTQTPGWGPFLWHMDALSMLPGTQNYAYRAPKCINKNLYEKMGTQDIRRQWWDPENNEIKVEGVVLSNYIQVKFLFSDAELALGDKIWMRMEDMYLIEAEAQCRMGQDGEARRLLIELVSTRDPNYTTSKSGTALGALTSNETGSLLEEILIHRRIELWGEYGRIFDIKRLKQGFRRTQDMGWTLDALLEGTNTQNPETFAWVLTIPQAEFDGNENMDLAKDQNPMGDGI